MSLDNEGRPEVPVHVCWNDTEAEVIIGLLRAHDIEASANSAVPHSVLPLTANGLGEVSVLVREGDAARAREIIRDAGEDGETG
jgi:hypothetical protein